MVVFWDKKPVTTLNEVNKLVIKPAGTWHIHVNPYDQISLTYWNFDGDIKEIIKTIKNSR